MQPNNEHTANTQLTACGQSKDTLGTEMGQPRDTEGTELGQQWDTKGTASGQTARQRRESARKARRKAENKPRLARLKQSYYYSRTGCWEPNPSKLHWHHVDPTTKYRKLCHLLTRSWGTICREVNKCIVLNEIEHRAHHEVHVLRTK